MDLSAAGNTAIERLELDDSGYQRSAQGAIATAEKLADSLEGTGKAAQVGAKGLELFDQKIQQAGGEILKFDRAQRTAQGAFERWGGVADKNERAFLQLVRAENELDRAVKQGHGSRAQMAQILESMWHNTIGAADAAKRHATALDDTAASIRAVAEAEAARAAATERSRQVAETAQLAYAKLLNVNPGSGAGSARASASVFEEQAQAQEDAARTARQLESANEALRRKYSPLYAAQAEYLAQLREIRAAGAAGVLSQQEQAGAIERTKAGFVEQVQVIRGGADKMAGGWKLNQQGLLQLQASGVNTFQSLASGMSVSTIAMTQGAQVLGAFVQGGILTGKVLLGVGGALLGVGVAAGGLAVAIAKGVFEMKEMERVQRLTANAAGLTAGALMGIGAAAADAGNIGAGAARGIALEMAATGRLGAEVIGRLTAMTADYAEATGQSAAEAGAALAKSFADPMKAAEELDGAYNLLTASQLRHIRTLSEQGQRTQAQIVLADALNDRVKNLADEGLTLVGRAWRFVENAAKGAWDAMEGLGRGPTVEEKIAGIQERIENERAIGAAPGRIAQLEGRLAEFRMQKSGADALASSAAAEGVLRSEVKALADVTRGYQDFAVKQEMLRNQSARFETAIAGLNAELGRLGEGGGARERVEEIVNEIALLSAGARAAKGELESMRKPLEAAQAQTAIARQVASLTPAQRGPRQAYLSELDRASHGSQSERDNAIALASEAQTRALIEQNAAIADQNALFAINADQSGKVADAWLRSAAEGEAAAARRQAAQDAFQSGVDAETRARQILSQQADRAAEQGAAQVHSLEMEAVQRRAVAAASLKGAEAQRQAETQARVEQATLAERNALYNASAEQQERLRRVIAAKTAAIQGEAQATRDLATAQGLQQQADRLAMLEAEQRLIGATNEQRVVEIAHVQALVDLRKKEGDTLDENEQRYVANAERLAGLGSEIERQKSALTEIGNFFSQTFDRVGGAITEAFAKGERSAVKFGDIARGVASEAVQWFLKLAAINPLKNWVSGESLPTIGSIFGLAGGAGTAAAGAAGGGAAGGAGSFFAPITNAISSGFSSVTGGISSALFGTAAADISGGIGAITTAGTPGLFGTFGAGASTFAAAAPWIAAAAAIAIPLLSGLFGRKPSVGETTVGRITDLTDPASTVYTFDNGGDDETAVSGVIKAIVKSIETQARRFDGTVRPGSGFDIGYFPSPESGNNQPGGYNVKAIVSNILETDDRFKGRTDKEAVDDATFIALKEMVDYQSATLAEAVKNSSADGLSGLLEDMNVARDFQMLRDALADLEGTARVASIGVEGSLGELSTATLATAKQMVGIQKAAEDFAEQNARPIVDFLEKARELFPAVAETEQTRRITETGVYVSEGEGKRDRRFVAEGSDEFDRLTSGDNPLRVVTRIRSVTEMVEGAAEAYSDNLMRIADASRIANANARLLVETMTGEFEPALRGPFQDALEQQSANLRALAPQFEEVNEQIRANYKAFPELTAVLGPLEDALIDVTGTIETSLEKIRTKLQGDWKRSMQDIIDPQGAQYRGLSDWFDTQVSEIRSLWDRPDASLDEILASSEGQLLLSAYTKQLAEIQDLTADYVAALQDEADAVQGAIDKHQALGETMQSISQTLLRQWQSVQTGDRSPLSARDQFDFASEQWFTALAASKGDPELESTQLALQSLPSLQDEYLREAEEFYGDSVSYYNAFKNSQGEIKALSGKTATLAEQHFAEAKRQSELLVGIQAKIEGIAANDNAPLYVQGSDGQYVSTGRGGLPAGFDLGYNAPQSIAIYNALKAAGYNLPTGFGEGQLGAIRQQAGASAIIDAIDARYADGGISYGPQVAMVSEGRYRAEAHVPLPDGRSIPVEIRGGMPGVDTTPMVRAVEMQTRLLADALADVVERLEAVERNTGSQASVARREAARAAPKAKPTGKRAA